MTLFPLWHTWSTKSETSGQHGIPPTLWLALLAIAAVLVARLAQRPNRYPVLNPRYPTEFGNAKAIQRFESNGASMMTKIKEEFADKPVTVNTSSGPVLVLPFKLADEIKSHAQMDMLSSIAQDFYAHIPGFEAFGMATVMRLISAVARKQLRLNMATIISLLSSEATHAVEQSLGHRDDWTSFNLNDICQDLVGRMSARAFVGEDMCRNAEWLGLVQRFTQDAFAASQALSSIPAWSHAVAHWFVPECRAVRAHSQRARELLEPMIHHRRGAKKRAQVSGEAVTFPDAALEWGDAESKGAYPSHLYHLSLSVVAVDTSADLLASTMWNIVQHPELISPLREEMVEALSRGALKESALAEMKLLDSVMKETQRLKPPEYTTLRRVATADITLSDGTFLPKGTKTTCLNVSRMDPNVYAKPDIFDARRFLRMREDPERAKKAHFVSTSTESLAFGNGRQACPGRFFASNEVKIAICHLLLKYDFALAKGVKPQITEVGFLPMADTKSEVLVRSRKPVLDLDSLSSSILSV